MTDIPDKIHAERSPSGASRWTRCPGSVVLERGRPDSTSIHAATGTVMHEIGEQILAPYAEGGAVGDAEAFVGRVFQVDGYDITVDMEMAEAVNEYASYVQTYVDVPAGDTLLVEQSVPIGHITGEEGACGTSDVVGITRGGTELVVIDLKGGRGVRVDADNNEQLLLYALGALHEHDLFHSFDTVLMVIIQPRLQHVSEWRISIDELRAKEEWFKVKAAAVDAAEAYFSEPKLTLTQYLDPGEKQCRFCKAKAICPALRQEVLETVTAGASGIESFDDLTVDDVPQTADAVREQASGMAGRAASFDIASTPDRMLDLLMDKVPLVEQWCLATRAEMDRHLLDGGASALFKLVEGRKGSRAWGDATAAEEALKKVARLKVDEMYSKTVISPTVAEKVLKGKPKVWAKIAPLIGERKDGKPSVAPISDKRPAWTPPVIEFDDLMVTETHEVAGLTVIDEYGPLTVGQANALIGDEDIVDPLFQ